jgi:hypothetical protein
MISIGSEDFFEGPRDRSHYNRYRDKVRPAAACDYESRRELFLDCCWINSVPNVPARPNSSNNQVAPLSETPVVGAGGGGGGTTVVGGGGGGGITIIMGGGGGITIMGGGGGGANGGSDGGSPPSGSAGFRAFGACEGDIGTATV